MEQYIPWIISALSLLVAFLSFSRTGRREAQKEDREQIGKLESLRESLLKANLKLDQVCATTTETRSDIKSLNKDLQSMDKRVTALEKEVQYFKDKIQN